MPDFLAYLWLCPAALAAGAINSIAGGGTLITFPTLQLQTGISDVLANGTNTTAVAPGALSGAWSFRRELQRARSWLILLAPTSVAGSVVGALLVTQLPAKLFTALVPWLVLFAAILFSAQPILAKMRGAGPGAEAPPLRKAFGIIVFQFLVGVYGGYFGAGIGILMLAGLGLIGLTHIHQMNALKNILGGLINGAAAVVFALAGMVVWEYAVPMAASAIVGGYLGAHFSQRVKPIYVRVFIVVLGYALAGHYFYKEFAPQ